MPQTDGERALADLKRLADFGRYQTGVHRPTYSKEDVASRHWLAEQFAAAGLDPVIDGIGNVIGRNPHGTRRLLVGSHSETQPRGGWLDGALGVIYALELARAFAADPALNGLAIEPIAWADEEGHFGNMLGSRSFTGALPESEIEAGRSRDGVPLAPRSPKPGLPAARASSSIPAVMSATSKLISSRATCSTDRARRSGLSRRSLATGTTG